MKKPISALVFCLALFSFVSPVFSATFSVDSTTDAVDSSAGDGYCDTDATLDNTPCTLRAAIQETNALGDSNTITLPAGTYSLTLVMIDEDVDGLINEENDDTQATGDLDIQNNLTITGEGASTTIIDAKELLDCTNDINDRVLQVYSGYTVALSGMNIEKGGSQSNGAGCTKSGTSFFYGGGIYNSGALSLTSVMVTDNEADIAGGGIYSNGTLTMTESYIAGNESEGGAGIYNEEGTLSMTGSTIIGNVAETMGGGVVSGSGTATISKSTIYYNFAPLGGGLASFAGTTTVTDTVFLDNMSYLGGGLICAYSTLGITNSTFSDNYAFAVTLEGDEEVVCDDGNDNDGDGLTDSDDNDCSSTLNGGETSSECYDSTDNDGDGATDTNDLDCILGSGAALSDFFVNSSVGIPCTVTLTNSTFSGNTADNRGGAINSFQSTFNLNNVTVTDNGESVELAVGATISETDYGGGIHLYGGSVSMRNSILAGNTGTSSPDCYGAISSNDYNLLGDQSGCTFTASSNDQVGDSSGSGILDPLLDALSDNGGSTSTHALQSNSPAIDKGNESGCTDGTDLLSTDQRGEERHQDATSSDGVCTERCDIGAYELAGTDSTCVDEEDCDNGVDDDLDGGIDCDDTDCSADPACEEPPVEDCDNGTDDDGDGMIDCDDPDCVTDSACEEVYIPSEDCDNGVDDDLDGAVDCNDTDCSSDPACETAPEAAGEEITEEACEDSGGTVLDATALGLDAVDAIQLANGKTITLEVEGVTYTVTPVKTEDGKTTISVTNSNAVDGGVICLEKSGEFKLEALGSGCRCDLNSGNNSSFSIRGLFPLLQMILLSIVALLYARCYVKGR